MVGLDGRSLRASLVLLVVMLFALTHSRSTAAQRRLTRGETQAAVSHSLLGEPRLIFGMTATPSPLQTPVDEPGPDASAVDPWPPVPVYPWRAFDSRRWIEAHRIPTVPRAPSEGFSLHCSSEKLRYRLTSEWDRVNSDRAGVLQGDFVPLENGLMLLDNAGAYITVNIPTEPHIADLSFKQANDPNLWSYAQSVRDHWDELPIIENGAIFSHIYHKNYYHFSMELLQKFRLSEALNVTTIAVPPKTLETRISREMMSRALGERTLITTDQFQPNRFRNPALVQAYQSDEALRWLRKLVGKTVQPGDRRYYIRRAPSKKKRLGNNIAETDEFLAFLRRHQFIPIDFGNGDLSIEEQIDKLEGASVVLASHGAGLTNISYLNPPVRIIEVFGGGVISNSFIRISQTLGLEHHAVISENADSIGDIIVDCALLDRLVAGEEGPN